MLALGRYSVEIYKGHAVLRYENLQSTPVPPTDWLGWLAREAGEARITLPCSEAMLSGLERTLLPEHLPH